MSVEPPVPHRWSGLPGSCRCLDCGCREPLDDAFDDILFCPENGIWETEEAEEAWVKRNARGLGECAEPYSMRHDPQQQMNRAQTGGRQ